MTQFTTATEFFDVDVADVAPSKLDFIENAEYEFVGGGTAVNGL